MSAVDDYMNRVLGKPHQFTGNRVRVLDGAADAYRLSQAEDLLRGAGFIERADGTWHPGAGAR